MLRDRRHRVSGAGPIVHACSSFVLAIPHTTNRLAEILQAAFFGLGFGSHERPLRRWERQIRTSLIASTPVAQARTRMAPRRARSEYTLAAGRRTCAYWLVLRPVSSVVAVSKLGRHTATRCASYGRPWPARFLVRRRGVPRGSATGLLLSPAGGSAALRRVVRRFLAE